jgi:hypothetical protein
LTNSDCSSTVTTESNSAAYGGKNNKIIWYKVISDVTILNKSIKVVPPTYVTHNNHENVYYRK